MTSDLFTKSDNAPAACSSEKRIFEITDIDVRPAARNVEMWTRKRELLVRVTKSAEHRTGFLPVAGWLLIRFATDLQRSEKFCIVDRLRALGANGSRMEHRYCRKYISATGTDISSLWRKPNKLSVTAMRLAILLIFQKVRKLCYAS